MAENKPLQDEWTTISDETQWVNTSAEAPVEEDARRGPMLEGLKQGTMALVTPFFDAWERGDVPAMLGMNAVKHAAEALTQNLPTAVGTAMGKLNTAPEEFPHAMWDAAKALPFVGPLLTESVEQYKQGGIGQATGFALGQSIPTLLTAGVSGPASKLMTRSAENSYAKVLRGGNKAEQAIVRDKVIPGMMKQRFSALTMEGAAHKSAALAETALNDLQDAYKALPPNSRIHVQPIIDQFTSWAREKAFIDDPTVRKQTPQGPHGIVEGPGFPARVVLHPEIINEVGKLTQDLMQFADKFGTISVDSARKYKAALWDYLKDSQGIFNKDVGQKQILDTKKHAAIAIADEFRKDFPNLDKVNAEFNMQKNIADAIQRSTDRRRGKEPSRVGEWLTAGALFGSGAKAAIATNVALRVFHSPGWRLVSGANKTRVAEALASGNATRGMALATALVRREQERNINEPLEFQFDPNMGLAEVTNEEK